VWSVLVASADRDRRRQLMALCQSPHLPLARIAELVDPRQLTNLLRSDHFHCILLDVPLFDSEWIEMLRPLGHELHGAYCLVTAQRTALHPQSQETGLGWLRIIRGEPLESDQVINELRNLAASMGCKSRSDTGLSPADFDHRADQRYELIRPLMAIPVGPDHAPQRDAIFYGFTTDFSLGGVRFHLPANLDAIPKRWVIGVEHLAGSMYFATVMTRNVSRDATGQRVVGTEIVLDTRDVFFEANLQPQFDPVALRVQTGMRDDVREQWVELGVLEAQFVDYLLVCPDCEGLLTWRRGCSHCGSGQVQCQQLIHHYACAHVGPLKHFEQPTGLVCPKCRSANLVIGVDFEYQNGEFFCHACSWTDSHLENVAQCLRCKLRFPGSQAMEKELLGYHLRRLDPLAFIGAA
jgi:hypothetical protein